MLCCKSGWSMWISLLPIFFNISATILSDLAAFLFLRFFWEPFPPCFSILEISDLHYPIIAVMIFFRGYETLTILSLSMIADFVVILIPFSFFIGRWRDQKKYEFLEKIFWLVRIWMLFNFLIHGSNICVFIQ